MPKANKVGKSRINAKSDKLNESSKTTDDVPNRESKTPQLSRGQKKKLAKRQQYEARMVSHWYPTQAHNTKHFITNPLQITKTNVSLISENGEQLPPPPIPPF